MLLAYTRGEYHPVTTMLPIWKKTDASDKTATVQIDSFKEISKIVGANTPLYVITVVGEYHTGKSSLNNALADENVFEVASDIPPQTQVLTHSLLLTHSPNHLLTHSFRGLRLWC